jgi:hypothetical protein
MRARFFPALCLTWCGELLAWFCAAAATRSSTANRLRNTRTAAPNSSGCRHPSEPTWLLRLLAQPAPGIREERSGRTPEHGGFCRLNILHRFPSLLSTRQRLMKPYRAGMSGRICCNLRSTHCSAYYAHE